MLEKIKRWISVAAFVLNAIGMIERGVLATLQSPLVLVFPLPVENSITQSLKQSSRHGRTRPRPRYGQLACPSSPGLFLYLADFPALDCTDYSEFGECSADG